MVCENIEVRCHSTMRQSVHDITGISLKDEEIRRKSYPNIISTGNGRRTGELINASFNISKARSSISAGGRRFFAPFFEAYGVSGAAVPAKLGTNRRYISHIPKKLRICVVVVG